MVDVFQCSAFNVIMSMFGAVAVSGCAGWKITFVFVTLTVRPRSLDASEKASRVFCRSACVWAAIAQSSAYCTHTHARARTHARTHTRAHTHARTRAHTNAHTYKKRKGRASQTAIRQDCAGTGGKKPSCSESLITNETRNKESTVYTNHKKHCYNEHNTHIQLYTVFY